MEKDARIYVAGHRGLVGSSLVRSLHEMGFRDIVTRSHAELDLSSQSAVESFFEIERPEYVFLAAAKVGGIHANNTYPAEFIYQNLAIEINVIHAAWKYGVKRLLFLGSSCIYPRDCPQPIKEKYLLTGPLEQTNRSYAVAKIAGIEMCWAYNRQYGTRFLPVMPTNLYGPNDNYDLMNAHVIPAMIRKFHLARLAMEKNWPAIEADERCYGPIPTEIKQNLYATCTGKQTPRVVLWGTGTPKREFLYSDDLAEACIRLMDMSDSEFDAVFDSVADAPLINIGVGTDITIRELAEMVRKVVGYDGEVVFDHTRPDGTPRKVLDVRRMQEQIGWRAKTTLEDGLRRAYADFCNKCALSQ